MDQTKIGGFLKELRKEKNLTQEQFAEHLGVSGRTVSRWETGSNMPDISLLVEIAEFFDVSIPELIDGERKSGNMEQEVKEVAEKMSDYAGTEKETVIKNIKNLSLIGMIALIVNLTLETIGPDKIAVVGGYLNAYSKTLVYVTVMMVFFHATGLLYKYKRKNKESDLPKAVRYILAGVIAFAVAFAIKFIMKLF